MKRLRTPDETEEFLATESGRAMLTAFTYASGKPWPTDAQLDELARAIVEAARNSCTTALGMSDTPGTQGS